MATITSAGSGLASATSTWVGSVVPVEGDKVIIAAGHVVELDGTFTWGDDNVTTTIGTAAVSVSGTLKASRTVSSSLTVRGLLYCDYATHAMDFGTLADPIPLGVTATLILNKHTTPAVRSGLEQRANTTSAHWIKHTYCGYARQRRAALASDASGSSVTLTAAPTGWQVGDEVFFFNTSLTGTVDQCETRTIASISGATVTLSSALTYTHKAGSPVCNLTSNVLIRSFNEVSGQMADPRYNYVATVPTLGVEFRFSNVRVQNLGNTGVNSGAIFTGGTNYPAQTTFVDSCVCFNDKTNASFVGIPAGVAPQPFVTTNSVGIMNGPFAYGSATHQIDNCCHALNSSAGFFNAVLRSSYATNCWITGRNTAAGFPLSDGLSMTNCTFSGFGTSIGGSSHQAVETVYDNCDFGATFGYTTASGDQLYRTAGYPLGGRLTATLKDCIFNATTSPIVNASWFAGSDNSEIRVVNKDRDVTQQQLFKPAGTQNRENTTKFRGTSSIAFTHRGIGKDLTRTQSIPCANGQTIRIVGYVRMDTDFWNAGDNNLPTVTLSGLGATPVTFTASAAANNAWEQFDLSITNASGADGNFTLTYTANAKTVSTGTVYFDGVPDSPFVTKVRHYGFLFNETSPTREVNPYTVASEATAAAYTGVTINATTKRVTFGVGTADTLAKVYDYSQAWAVTNIDKEVPWTRAGALLSLTSGWTVVDPVISGVTWGGGTVEYSTPGNIEASFDTTTIEFTTAGTYSMGDSVFAGNIELTNTSGGSVTVELPSGTSYTNTGPSITVTTPVLYQSVTINGLVTGSRVYIYDTVTATVLANAVASGSSYTWTDTVAASADRNIWLRVAYQSGATAKKFIDVAIGTCGTTDLTAALTYLVNQEDDTVYITNAIDGSTVTGISIDDSIDRVVISIAGGAVTWPEIYAYQVYWLATSAGIVDDAAIIEAVDTANYLLYSFQIRNTSTVPLTITGGYGRDAVTETVAGCIDVTGSTGNIYPAPDHVVPFSTGSGLTAGQAAKLESLDTQAVNVVSIKGQAINGSGTESDPWGP